jgi:hypothetical protein
MKAIGAYGRYDSIFEVVHEEEVAAASCFGGQAICGASVRNSSSTIFAERNRPNTIAPPS